MPEEFQKPKDPKIFGFTFPLRKTLWFMPLVVMLCILLVVSDLGKGRNPLAIYVIPLLVAVLLQAVFGIWALFRRGYRELGFWNAIMGGGITSVGVLFMMAGGGWGRPLRIKGKQLHPELREGTDWTRGELPNPAGLDEATRTALAALWLHDAQKEHASVPAFSRISWMLAAIGAPAELMEWSHRAALEEIEHTRICFALAAGYGGKNWSVEPMPDLLLGGLDSKDDPVIVLAKESLEDGCQLEDFNADIAHACSLECEEPATRKVLEQIAREERLHADFSWALLEWLYERWPAKVRPEMEKGLLNLPKIHRPTAVSWEKQPLVQAANPELLKKHGRLPDERWGELWAIRLAENKKRLEALLHPAMKAAA